MIRSHQAKASAMESRYVIVARYAEFLPDGSVNILGGDADKILADGFPATHSSLSVAVRIALSREEAASKHSFKTLIIGPDEEIVHEGIAGTIEAFDPPAETTRVGIGLVMTF